MQVVAVPIDQLVFDPSNARRHSTKNIEAIKGSLAKFGQQKPIIIDKNKVVIAGNGTLAAAKELNWVELKCLQSDLVGAEALAFALADNRTAELAQWDDEVLGKILHGLREQSFDLTSIGFDTSYLDKLWDEPTITGSKELGENEFSEFDHKCPKCGFEFDATED